MANSNLQGKYWEFDDVMYNHLDKIFNAYNGDQTVKGYSRLKGLLSDKQISYEQMKRIKNFFDTHQGDNHTTPYLLNGGTKMKQWVDDCLDNSRQDIKGKKKSMMDIGMDNQFQKDGGTRDQDSSGERIKTSKVGSSSRQVSDNRGIYEMNVLSNLMTTIYGNSKNLY